MFFTVAVRILRLSVPQSVENGTDHVILDCEYNYSVSDLRLVVKWFYNENLEPIYQWIPKLNTRHISEMLFGRLNLSYKVNSLDPYYHYRALYLLRPTLDIAGKYTCQVMSLAGHDQRHQVMLVYAPAKRFSLTQTDVSISDMEVSCEAVGLYPRPQVSLKIIFPDTSEQLLLQKFKKYMNVTSSLYSIWLSGSLRQSDFPDRNMIVVECEVYIPYTDYKVSRTISYYPGLTASNTAPSGGLTWLNCCLYVAVLFF
ncbi:uncharacterized protein LOC143246863 isoform X1 [Tachypleus tridentatus]|uniref:uncharacterized protein LOC143246863 isoform X1 n=1 Tax=Tachypleus tridentatus TaxID=6853 RepID=UPI003FCFE8C7